MTASLDTAAFEHGADPILRCTIEQAREIANYKDDTKLRRRIEELAGKGNEGGLTDRERAELEGYVRANKFIALLQAQVRRLLDE
jgi:hypothetical protein